MLAPEAPPPPQRTRRSFLKAGVLAGAVLGGAAVAGVELLGGSGAHHPLGLPADHETVWKFHSRPDLRPAMVVRSAPSGGRSAVAAEGGDPELLFLGPKGVAGAQPGALIADQLGRPVYFTPAPPKHLATMVRAWQYRGDPVLAWWHGRVIPHPGYGQGQARIVDSTYRTIAHVRAANGRLMDLHALRITPQGTALFTCFPTVLPANLSALGGPRKGRVMESVIQEVDIATGRLLMEWRSLEHISPAESYHPLMEPFDYLHLNSIDITPDGHLLVSGRHTWALYKLDRTTGRVIWRLGGKRSDFRLGPGARFTWQHDATQIGRARLTVFDDGSDGPTKSEKQSRGLVLRLDETGREVTLERAYVHPRRPLLSVAMGSVQSLSNGNVLVGWGTSPYTSEFTPDGALIADWEMATKQLSYRAFLLPWTGRPHFAPAIALQRDGGQSTLYASWNGSTETARWLLEAGPSPGDLRPVASAARTGFETAISAGRARGYVAVSALDAHGRRLGRSRTIAL